MKSKITLLYILLLTVFFAACNNDDEEDDNGFHIVVTDIQETPESLSGIIVLSSEDFEFEVRHDWCEVVKSGNKLILNTDINFGFMNRTTEVKIRSGKKTIVVPVTQTGMLLDFSLDSDTKFNFNYDGGVRRVRILSNVDYEIVIPEEYKDWISVDEVTPDVFNINIATSDVNRLGSLSFEYLGKALPINIKQYNFLSYQQLLGEVTMSYTNSLDERVTTQVVLSEKEKDKVFNLTGTFESGVERTIPLTYLVDSDGELRFYPAMLQKPYTDPADSRVGSMTLLIQATQKKVTVTEPFYVYPTTSGLKQYYPGKAEFVDAGSLYRFAHSPEGVPNGGFGTTVYPRETHGVIVAGTSAAGTSRYITYDTIFDIVITKIL